MRSGSIRILAQTAILAAKLALCGLILYGAFLLVVMGFPEQRRTMVAALLSPAVIAVITIVVVCYAWARRAVLARF